MAIFKHDNHEKNYTCPAGPSYDTEAPDPFVGDLSFHEFNLILSGICTALVCVITLFLMFQHATHLSKPREQIKIMKICLILPLYTITSYIAICVPDAAVYITPWMDVYQAFALASFFLLLCEFVSADKGIEYADFFAGFAPPRKNGKTPANGTKWFKNQWRAIFQYPVVSVGVAIATDVTEAMDIYCLESNSAHFAHLWLTIIGIISLAMAVIAILRFYKALKADLATHQPLAKLLAFKLIVGLSLLEEIIFSILRSTSALSPSNTLSNGDTEIGIPQLVVCIQMVPFALFFPYAYSWKPYTRGGHDAYRGVGRAWIGLLNPVEIIRGVKGAVTGEIQRGGKRMYSLAGNPAVGVPVGVEAVAGPAPAYDSGETGYGYEYGYGHVRPAGAPTVQTTYSRLAD
ncbi:organic solute transporter Ostalpha-domain-containing protein [Aspergillus unguis]